MCSYVKYIILSSQCDSDQVGTSTYSCTGTAVIVARRYEPYEFKKFIT